MTQHHPTPNPVDAHLDAITTTPAVPVTREALQIIADRGEVPDAILLTLTSDDAVRIETTHVAPTMARLDYDNLSDIDTADDQVTYDRHIGPMVDTISAHLLSHSTTQPHGARDHQRLLGRVVSPLPAESVDDPNAFSLVLANDGAHWCGTFGLVLTALLNDLVPEDPIEASIAHLDENDHDAHRTGRIVEFDEPTGRIVWDDGATTLLSHVLAIGI